MIQIYHGCIYIPRFERMDEQYLYIIGIRLKRSGSIGSVARTVLLRHVILSP